MTRFGLAGFLLLVACNPADVDPAPAERHAPTPAAAPAKTIDRNESGETESPGFTATGAVRCVTRARWAVRDCAAGVIRSGGGAVVTVFHPEGRSRDILFDPSGRATGVRTAEADGSDRQPFSASRAGAVTIVRLGPERYEVPDTLLRRN